MVDVAVDNWARDLATEAKEVATLVNAKHDSHEAKCNERHIDQMGWQEKIERKIDGIRRDMLYGVCAIVIALAVVAWALVEKKMGL